MQYIVKTQNSETIENMKKYFYETGPIRPPSEGGSDSLLIRVTRNCPWNKCKFCELYKNKNFSRRSVEEVMKDIDAIKGISDEIQAISRRFGYGGEIKGNFGDELIKAYPDLGFNLNFITVFNWLASGGKIAFLQDANSLIVNTGDLIEILSHLTKSFPKITRVTSYARAKTLFRKSLDELKDIYKAGLKRLHIGLETGDDELLKYIKKGVTGEEHVIAGEKVKQAGFELSEYVMPGLAGRDGSEQHAKNTARVLNEINPDFIRLRPFIPRPNTELYDAYKRRQLQLSSPHERLREIRTLMKSLNVRSRICFDHMINSWRKRNGEPLFKLDYNGYQFPDQKSEVLELIDEGLKEDESIHISVEEMIRLSHL